MHPPMFGVLAVQLAHQNSPAIDRESHQFENPQPHAEPSLLDEISDELRIGLNYFDLSSNAFSNMIPRSVVNLTQLQLINLLYNQFFGEIPMSFGELQQLRWDSNFLLFIFFIFVVFQWFLTKITWLFNFNVSEIVRFIFFSFTLNFLRKQTKIVYITSLKFFLI